MGESPDIVHVFLDRRDEESFSAMFRLLSPTILRYFRLRGCPLELAEDLTQEVMFIVYTHSARLRDRNLFQPWLFQIARNAWLQHRRQQQRRVQSAALDNLDETFCAANPDLVEASSFAEWLGDLNPGQRELAHLRYVEGFEYHELATMLNLPIGTVQWKVFQLKRILASRLGVSSVASG